MGWTAWLASVVQDVRLGCRSVSRSAAFTALAVLVLGCGIGFSVAIFSVADVVLRRPLPIEDEAGVVVLWGRAVRSMRTLPLTPAHFDRYRREARALRDVAGTVAVDSWAQAVRDGDDTFRANLSPVTGNFFSVLGVTPVVGRTLREEDDRAGAPPVAVISYSFWRRRYASNPAVLGRRLALQSDHVFTVIGVAPAGLEYPGGTEIWIPFAAFPTPEVTPLGRLRAGVSARDAERELQASFNREPTREWTGLAGAATPIRALIVGDLAPALLLLSVAAALLLATACLNVGSLLLVRGSARRVEFAVRRALGADGRRITRQLLAESVPLALLAGVLGAWLAVQLLRLLALAPADVPRLEEVRLQPFPLVLAAVVSAAAAFGAALVPALWLARGVSPSLRASDRSTTATRGTVTAQRALVVCQVSLAVVVLFAAGLLIRSLRQLEDIDTGLDIDRLAIVELGWPDSKFRNAALVGAFYDRLLSRIAVLPGVVSTAPVNVVPFTGATGGWDGRFVAEGQPDNGQVFSLSVVGEDYFPTMGIRLRRGRAFEPSDREGAVPIAIVSEDAGRVLWPGQIAVGKRIRLGEPGSVWRTVVGVAPENRYRALRESAPTVYLPMRQFVEVLPLVNTVAVRTAGPPERVLASLRMAVKQTDPGVATLAVSGMRERIARQLATPRLNAVLLGAFGAGALLLAAVGLYAVMAGTVRERRRELAIRQAIGATPGRLRALVVLQALTMCSAGLALGLVVSFGAGRALASILYGVEATDGRTIAGVLAILLATCAIASYVPARRATQADTMELLRQE